MKPDYDNSTSKFRYFIMIYIVLYSLLYVFVLVTILLKVRHKQKIHVLWYITIGLLTIIPLILMFFSSEFSENVSIKDTIS